jgi:glycosyltransferase involved in cell wall biosynthesis
MKKISIVVPTYNEGSNILRVYNEITLVMVEELNQYEYEILFIDNCSVDSTRSIIETLCNRDKKIKAIFNSQNFGLIRSSYYGLINATGDCAVLLYADLQTNPSLIKKLVMEWDVGYKVVLGIKKYSNENKILKFFKQCYYKLMKKISEIQQIENFSDFVLLDRDFLEILRKLNDPLPYLRGIIFEFGFRRQMIYYKQDKRKQGKGSKLMRLYDFGMLGITSYSKIIMRLSTLLGFILSVISFIVGTAILIIKIIHWNDYQMGIAAIGVGVFILGSMQLFFIGLLGEYILNINIRVMNRPLVIEERRINFE